MIRICYKYFLIYYYLVYIFILIFNKKNLKKIFFMRNEDLDENNDKNNISNSFEEDNIKKNYVTFIKGDEFENNEEEKKENNISLEITENLDDDEKISNVEQEKQLKEKNKFQQISNILNKKKYIFLSIFLYILFIINLSISVTLYNLREVKHNFILLCFEFKPIPQNYITNEFFVFLTSVYAVLFYIEKYFRKYIFNGKFFNIF